MNSIQHGKEEFDKRYYARFFKKDGSIDFKTYENWFYGWYNFIKRFVNLEENKQKKVLEVGTAIGAFAKILTDKGFNVTATDISEFILKKAAVKNNKAKFVKLDIENPIRLDEKFDYIFAFEVLEHLKDPERGMRNIRDVIKEDGYFIFSTPFLSAQTLKDPTHISVHDPQWWLALGKKLGFREVEYKYASFLPLLYRWSRILSIGFPLKINNAAANSTCFYFFRR